MCTVFTCGVLTRKEGLHAGSGYMVPDKNEMSASPFTEHPSSGTGSVR